MAEELELSEREREILLLVATGLSNKEIAYKLVISPNTVKVHLRNIFVKIGVASRTEATLYAIRNGMLPSPFHSYLPIPEIRPPAPPEPPARSAPSHRELRRVMYFSSPLVLLLLLALGIWSLLYRPPAPAAAPLQPSPPALQRWSSLARLPAALQAPAGAVYDSSLFVIGGETGHGPSGQVWRYQPAAKSWQARAAKPTPVSQAGAAVLGEQIYVPGGLQAGGQPARALEVYDPRQDRWEQRASLPTPLSGYALAALEGRLYLFGGWDGQAYRSSVYVYDPALDSWSACSPLPSPRAYAAAAALSGKILVAGGYDGRQALSAAAFYFPTRERPGENPWEAAPPLPQTRYGMGAASLAGLVYLLGGEGSIDLPPLEYQAQSNSWRTFESPPQPAGSHLLLLALDTHLHALAGSLSANHQAYQAIYNVVFPVIQ